MKIRTSVQVAMIVGACTVLAPIDGQHPGPCGHAADDLDKLQVVRRGVLPYGAELCGPGFVEKAIYQGAIPGMLRTLDPHSTSSIPPNIGHAAQARAQYAGLGC